MMRNEIKDKIIYKRLKKNKYITNEKRDKRGRRTKIHWSHIASPSSTHVPPSIRSQCVSLNVIVEDNV